MGSIMDQERPWEREKFYSNQPEKLISPNPEKFICEHQWKSKFDFVYDYDHQICVKCKKTRMI